MSATCLRPNLAGWFGDSKVVDAEGKPKVYYHATFGDFSEFSNSRYKGWHFFASTPDEALSFVKNMGIKNPTGMKVMPVYLKVETPVRGNGQSMINGDKVDADTDAIFQGNDDDGVSPSIIAVRNPTQIKSAIGNNGDFDPTNPDITR